MKVLTGALAAALLMASSAWAQTTPQPTPPPSVNCAGFVPAPSLADGAGATNAQMAAANERYQAWATDRMAKLQTCRAEVDALRAQLNGLELSYNTGNGELGAVTQAWQADVDEFNARSGASGGRRERGGVITRPD